MWAENIMDFGIFCYLNIPCLRINIIFNIYEFLKRRIHALVGKLENRCFGWYPGAILGTPTWPFHTKLYKFT